MLSNHGILCHPLLLLPSMSTGQLSCRMCLRLGLANVSLWLNSGCLFLAWIPWKLSVPFLVSCTGRWMASLYPVTGEASLERLVKVASSRLMHCDLSVFSCVLNNYRDTWRLCKYPINCHTSPTNCGTPWFNSRTVITIVFTSADFLFPSFFLSLLTAVHLCIPLCVYISYGPMDICFILWNTIHPSQDLVSCSNYPRFVHLKLLQLVLVPFQDAIILFFLFLSTF